MSAKKWIVMFFGTIVLVLMLCAGFNMLVDPFGVFGDRLFKWDSYDQTNNPRVAKISYLDKHHEEYDSYIIGSSSAASYSVDELNEYMEARFYNLFVYGCDTTNYCNFARYVIEEYGAKNIVLNLGINETNSYDADRSSLNESEHAKLTDESLLKFYLKYALCNPKYSVEKLQSHRQDTELPQAFDVFLPETGCYDKRVRDVENIGDMTAYMEKYAADFGAEESEMEYIDECIESVEYIKKLCEENGVNLTVICSPVYEAQWNACPKESLSEYKKKLAEVTDYWDFSYSPISSDSRYFYDATHFRNAVGTMVLAKMFGREDVWYPENFGDYVTAENADEHISRLFSDSFGAENASGGADAAAAAQENPANAENSADESDETDGAAAEISDWAGIAPAEFDNEADVPILMYHHLDPVSNASTIVTPETFEEQMKLISDAGYHAVTMEQLVRYVYYGEDLPENPVCITFDDGYLSNYEIAYPILQKYQMKATIFAIGSSIGHSTYKDTSLDITPHFDWTQAAEMVTSGVIDIQSHTYDMHQWPEGEAAAAEQKAQLDGEPSSSSEKQAVSSDQPVRESAAQLDGESDLDYMKALSEDITVYQKEYLSNLGMTYDILSYPSGKYSVLSEVAASLNGIRATLTIDSDRKNTVVKGLPQTLFALARFNVTEETTEEELMEMLEYRAFS